MDQQTNEIKKYLLRGSLQTTAGGNGDDAHINQITDCYSLVINSDASYAYVSDLNNNRICRCSLKTLGDVFIIAGRMGLGNELNYLAHPRGIHVIKNHFYVADTGNGRLMQLPLPQEPSEQRRLERKLRKEAEQKQNEQPLSSQNGSATSQNNIAEVVTIEKSPRKSFFNQIIEQIDLNLLKNPAFTLFAVSNFLKNLGFNVIYNYSDDLANDLNVTKNQRIYIVMSVGLSSIFGRLIFGYIGDRKSMNRLFLFIITSIISGVATMVAPLSGSSIFLHIGYASLFGFFSGGSVTLTAIVLVDIVGISKLSDAFGVLLLFIGSAAALGTPIVGGLRDAFAHFPQPFLWPYLIVGSCTVVSGILLFAIPFLQRKKSSDDHMEIGCDAFYSAEDIPSQEQLQKF
ncbi:unnamed protein product [Rotaria sp. Silwood1]|nr:unnamed protein product [Rotaria sp. Silwood1]